MTNNRQNTSSCETYVLNGENAERGKGYIVTLFYILRSFDHTLKNILFIFLFMSIPHSIQYTLAKGDRTGPLAVLALHSISSSYEGAYHIVDLNEYLLTV